MVHNSTQGTPVVTQVVQGLKGAEPGFCFHLGVQATSNKGEKLAVSSQSNHDIPNYTSNIIFQSLSFSLDWPLQS